MPSVSVKLLMVNAWPAAKLVLSTFKSAPDNMMARGVGIATVKGGQFVPATSDIVEVK